MQVPSDILTTQFYDWERQGRGWAIADFPCELEPPFRPFRGHYIRPLAIIDDGKREPWWQRLASLVMPPPDVAQPPKVPQRIARPYQGSDELSILSLSIPVTFKQHAARMEQLLVMLSCRGRPISFELIGTADEMAIQLTVRESDEEYCRTQLSAFFPELSVQNAPVDMVQYALRVAGAFAVTDFGLDEEFMRPIAMSLPEPDCYTPLIALIDRLTGDEAIAVQVLFTGARSPWGAHMVASVTGATGKGSFFLDAPEMPGLATAKAAKPLCAVSVRALGLGRTIDEAFNVLKDGALAVSYASHSPFNSLGILQDETYTLDDRMQDILFRQSHRVGMLLNVAELAAIAHIPVVRSEKLHPERRATAPAPATLTGHPYILGTNAHQGSEHAVSISTDQRLRHVHMIGATGTGKSTLLKNLIVQDIYGDTGLMCLDPHGDLIEDILHSIPAHRIKDVVLIDPSDSQFPVALNILTAHSDLEKELLASDLAALFRRFSTSWGDQMNSVLANAILAFVYNSRQFHLGDLRRFLIEQSYRTSILSTVTDPDIAYYWTREFPLLKGTSIGSILTRLDAFLRPRIIRNMVCQTTCVDFAHLMDTGKIVLVKLSQGLLGAENSYLLGAFIVSKLQQIAMARQAQEREARVPFFCYIDEFHHFATPSMAEILSGTRKYGLGLVLSHQDMQQVSTQDTEIAGSVLSNAGTRICFRLGDTDAKRLGEGFARFTAADLQNLAVGEAITRVNAASSDFNLDIQADQTSLGHSHREAIVAHSRSLYSAPVIAEQESAPIVQPEPRQEPKEAPPIEQPVPESAQMESEPPTTVVREHRYLQAFVKALAEGHGYRAQLEVPTPDGAGMVDVLLEKDDTAIAVEISVSNSAEYEVRNIQKCLRAGYGKVVLCSNNAKKLVRVETLLEEILSKEEQVKVHYVSPDGLSTVLDAQPKQETHMVMKGYRVKVQYDKDGPSKSDILQSIAKAVQRKQ
ncbi:type IV secretion system DNA-binding domain-containing protein [Mucilaginibacter sp. BJC16-A38]|uniref:type IV secretory system conjugative DNA transfer family protein n=1 Tax=Mucilaginibacter phenanthrenivorans TaxID=1234842 RepID=UPI0021575B48|nr:TraM recognition domain-containing protein [Mucilaginibacter phenanthrenivorans]MCR8559283.1 type IV secretion system DNA-binding domain-containing protein [Mucilaginibacter phenanthrenivorans]